MNLDNILDEMDNITQEKCEILQMEVIEQMQRKAILSKYVIKQLPNGGRYYVNLPNGKQPKKKNKKDLEDLVIAYEQSKSNTLVALFPQYLEDRKMTVKPTTWEKEIYYFETYLKNSKLGTIPIENIHIKDGHEFFQFCKTIKPDIKKRYWNNIHHSFINQMLIYAVQCGIIPYNPLKELKIKDFQFAPPDEKPEEEQVYLQSEKEQIIKLVMNEFNATGDPVCLGILILFQIPLRVGELCGLKWSDIDLSMQTISIKRQYTKGTLSSPKTKASRRTMLMPDGLNDLILNIKNANEKLGYPTDENDFIFLRKWHDTICPCTDRCFNNRLDHYCDKIGIARKSTHDIRRTTITELYENCHDVKVVQSLAGHSSQAMTEHYIKYRNRDREKEVLSSITIPLNLAEYNGMIISPNEKTANPYN